MHQLYSIKNLTVAFAVLFTTSSCSHKYFIASDFTNKTAKHKIVAVLPAEMVFTGKMPKNLKPEDIQKLEEKESLGFQESLYSSILKHANNKRYQFTVNVQDISNTQKLLKDKNISVRETWTMTDNELQEILGVDAIVRMRIQKQRYMSDLASYGLGVANRLLITQNVVPTVPVPMMGNNTNDIYASCNLSSKGITLWSDKYKRSSDWRRPSSQIIEKITGKFGKHFPYKQK